MTLAADLARIAQTPRTRVGPDTRLTGDAYVNVPPDELAMQAMVATEVYSLGRLVESEYGGGPPAALVGIAEVAVRRADVLGKSITEMLTYDLAASQSGFYGRQSGRWAATTLDPTERSIAAARLALTGVDLTDGSLRFFAPRTQDGGTQAGRALKYDAAGIVERWGEEGYRFAIGAKAYELGVDPYKLMFLTKRPSGATLDQALAVIDAGRAGRPYTAPSGGALALVVGGAALLAIKVLA